MALWLLGDGILIWNAWDTAGLGHSQQTYRGECGLKSAVLGWQLVDGSEFPLTSLQGFEPSSALILLVSDFPEARELEFNKFIFLLLFTLLLYGTKFI